MGERIDVEGLREGYRLMQTAVGLGGDVRRDIERKAVQTFWRSVGISEGSVTDAGALPDTSRTVGRVLRRSNGVG